MDELERERRLLKGARALALWAEVNDIADTVWAEADAAAVRDRAYPLVAARNGYLLGTGHGTISYGLGPFAPNPPFTVCMAPPKTHVWRYIEAPPSLPMWAVEEPLSPIGPQLKIHDVRLHQWAEYIGRTVTCSWWVAWVPELNQYILSEETGYWRSI